MPESLMQKHTIGKKLLLTAWGTSECEKINWCRKVTDFLKDFASKGTRVFITLDLFPGSYPHLYLWTYLQHTEVHQPMEIWKFSKVKQQKDLSNNYFNICANIYSETSMEKRKRLSQKWSVNRIVSIITAFLNCK